MSIVATNKTSSGQTIVIRSAPIVGLLTLTSFTDDATGVGGSASFIKTFRYSTNGVIFSQWYPLTVPAITAIKADPTDPFIIEVNYLKQEPTNGTSVLDVNSFTIGDTTQAPPATPFFDNSLFKQYFNSTDQGVLNWYVNVLEKLWEKGLIPNYMTRDFDDPDDFLDIWSAVSEFFAYYVTFARTFATFYNNYDILSSFLTQRGLQVSPEDTLDQLQTMLSTFYFQMAKRGTQRIFADTGADTDGTTGEFRRTIHYKSIDEFLALLYRPENFGWCLGHSSPLYRGVRVNDGLNKTPWSVGYNDMTNAGPYLTSPGVVTTDGGVKVASLQNSEIDINNLKVDPNLDYEFSFQIELAAGGEMTFNIHGFDANGNAQNLLSYKDGSVKSAFFTNAVLVRSDKYLMVRCYLYNHARGTFSGDTTNIRQGQNLVMTTGVQKVSLSIVVTGNAKVKDFKILPMFTDYSRGFLQANHFISAWLKNRNTVYSVLQLEDYVNTYLVPYNSHVKISNLGDYLYQDAQTEPDTTYWVGAGEYCRQVVWIGSDPSCEVDNLIWVVEESTAYCEQA